MRFGFLIFLLLLLATPSLAQTVVKSDETVGPSGLPLPRFVSISAGEANLRSGPGERYPILWVYQRRNLPVQITAEYGNWRKIEDMEGVTGWMHSALLSGRRTMIITGDVRTLRRDAALDASPALKAEAGVIGQIEECAHNWCELEIEGRYGWIPAEYGWGIFDLEEID